MARESVVLLKNENNTLPLRRNLKKIAVLGPNADNERVQLGNYNGFPTGPGRSTAYFAYQYLYQLGPTELQNADPAS